MSTHITVFQAFFKIFALFDIGQLSHQQNKGKDGFCHDLLINTMVK